MKVINFKAKTSNLKYPVLEDSVVNCTDQSYNMFMINETLKKLESTVSVEDFNTKFGTSEDETISWTDFNLEFLRSTSTNSLFIVNTNNVHSYNINNITGVLEHV